MGCTPSKGKSIGLAASRSSIFIHASMLPTELSTKNAKKAEPFSNNRPRVCFPLLPRSIPIRLPTEEEEVLPFPSRACSPLSFGSASESDSDRLRPTSPSHETMITGSISQGGSKCDISADSKGSTVSASSSKVSVGVSFVSALRSHCTSGFVIPSFFATQTECVLPNF